MESGAADILELVTPTTAELLMWWFGEDMVLARSGLNFHAGQKQAILNAIVAHEVLGQGHENWTLLDLYRSCAPDALLSGTTKRPRWLKVLTTPATSAIDLVRTSSRVWSARSGWAPRPRQSCQQQTAASRK